MLLQDLWSASYILHNLLLENPACVVCIYGVIDTIILETLQNFGVSEIHLLAIHPEQWHNSLPLSYGVG